LKLKELIAYKAFMQKTKLKVSVKAFCIAQQVQIESTLKFEKLLYAVQMI